MSTEVKIESFMACSCIHVPFQNDASVDWMIGRLSDLKPNVFVFLGDLFDAGAVSVHPNEYMHSLENEFEAGAKIFSRIMKASPKTEFVWCLGNHDDNIRSPDPRRSSRQIRSLLDWNNHGEFGRVFREWKQIPYRKDSNGVFKLGQVCFYHGFDAGGNSDELESIQMSMLTGGQAWRLFIRGHTHRPTANIMQCKRTQNVVLPWFYANAGTLGPKTPSWMFRRDSSQWKAALVVGETNINSPRRPSISEWSASMEIHK